MSASSRSNGLGPMSLEVRALRRSVRDMIAFAGLRALWVGQGPGDMAKGFAEALLSALDLRFVFLRCSTASIGAIEVLRAAEPSHEAAMGRLLERLLPSLARRPGRERVHLPAPDDERPLSLSIHSLGGEEDFGIVVMGSERLGFPNEYERSLIAIGTMQLGLALGEHEQFARWRLEELSRRLVQMQEEERRTIARELHDEVGQILTGLKLMLEAGSRPGGSVDLAQLRDVTSQLLERVRDLSLDLRPPMLDDLGLVPTLLWHFDRYHAQTGIQVRFQHRGVSHRLPVETEITAFRIVQESLTNVARHAGVREVFVELWLQDDLLGLRVEDEGNGFDPARQEGPEAGLTGMRERASLTGGRLSIWSRPNQGTRLAAELPVNLANEAQAS